LQVIIELPHILVQALVYGIIVYVMMGFERTVTKLLWNLFFTYFSFLYYTYYGMMTMAITPNPHVAGILSTSFYAIWCLFSGFIIPLSVSYLP
jgi:ABC-type multidrug transport system permease subunit